MIQTIDFEQLIEFLKTSRADWAVLTPSDIKGAISKQTGKIFCKVYYNKETNEIQRWFAHECVLDTDEMAEQRDEYRRIAAILQDLWPEGFTRDFIR